MRLPQVAEVTKTRWKARAFDRCPKAPDGGNLADHIFAKVTEAKGGARISVGTSGVDYAAAVHEGVHPPKWRSMGATIIYSTPGTDWKFIEVPGMTTASDTTRPLLAAMMREAIK
jgi:hypothetical protein